MGEKEKIRAGVIVYRKNLHPSPVVELFQGDGEPSRHIGTVIFALAAPPFKRLTTDSRRPLSAKVSLDRLQYMMPSSETLCYVVAPRWEAITGALREHEQEQNVDSPAWRQVIRAIFPDHRLSA